MGTTGLGFVGRSAARSWSWVIGLCAACVPGVLPLAAGAEPVRRTAGEVVMEDVPEVPAALRERMNQYLNVRSASLLDFDDTGSRILISTRFGNTEQLHVVDHPMGDRRQITFFDEPVRGAKFVPGAGGRKILYSMDRGGTENNQIYLLNVEDGTSTLVTDGKSKNDALLMSETGKAFAFCSTARNGKDYDIYVGNPADGKTRRILDGSGMFMPSSFSPAADRLIVGEYISEKESHLHLVEVESGKSTPLTPREKKFAYGGGDFSADGKHLYFTSDEHGQFQALYRRELSTGKDTAITANLAWDVESIAVSPAGNAVAFTANEDGQSRLYLMKPDAAKYDPVTAVPMGLIGGLRFSRDGKRLGFSLNSPTTSGDVYVYSMDDGKLTRWTASELGGLNAARFVTPTRIAYPTFDQVDGKPRMIPAYYYRPAGDGPFPVIIQIHGGPEAQSRASFSSLIQYWTCEMKTAVLVPNVRGSTGYGRDYHMLDDGMKREDSVKDIGALLDWIEKQKELDAKRVAVYGGSYGGYMVLASLTNYPGRIKAGVDIVGIASFITFLEKTSPYRQDLRRAEYGDEREPAMRAHFEKISPLNNAEKIAAALYVQHGANDPRVPAFEAEQIVRKLRERGRTVWYFLAKDEGHGFAKKANRDLALLTSVMFLEEQLRR